MHGDELSDEARDAIQSELETQNIVYRPIVWSTFGRMHGAASDVSLASLNVLHAGTGTPATPARRSRHAPARPARRWHFFMRIPCGLANQLE